jgi:membrane protein
MWAVVSQTFREFYEDECPRLAAATAYYTFFALPALLVLIVMTAGIVLVNHDKDIEARLRSHFEETIGTEGAAEISKIVENARKLSHPKESGPGWVVGIGMLLLGATGALQELQTALNRAWHVEPDPKQDGFKHFLIKRLISLALLLGIAVLLIASLAVSWGLTAFGHWIDTHPNVLLTSRVIAWLHTGVSVIIITILFAALFRFLPDAKVDWSDVWAGAIVTTVLFWIGQWGLGHYLAWSKPTSAYGAAGSLALVLLWMYYSAMIFFLGAEFTQVLAQKRGKRIVPIRGARLSDDGSQC